MKALYFKQTLHISTCDTQIILNHLIFYKEQYEGEAFKTIMYAVNWHRVNDHHPHVRINSSHSAITIIKVINTIPCNYSALTLLYTLLFTSH